MVLSLPTSAPSRPYRFALAVALGCCLAACGTKGTDSLPGKTGANTSEAGTGERNAADETPFTPEELKLPMVTYAWNPNDGDKSVSAADGGPGFTGEGWTTNMTFPALGSQDAVRGGTIRMYIDSWPATLRLQGKDYNTAFNYRAVSLCQESLLFVHPDTLEFVPYLASHWKISEDKS
ncbi:MAG TPA: hypothetical protein PLJ12_00350, partial [Planctomycetota bacterium]|nr:hypothetical protein [Planctomycetota bacterium]